MLLKFVAQRFETFWEKEKMLLTSIIFFFLNFFKSQGSLKLRIAW